MSGKLFMVATPIGNLGDMSARAIETLKSVDKIYAEDTRVARKLLSHFNVRVPVDSYHDHSDFSKFHAISQELESGRSLALVTDAGTPGVSDPGNELVAALLAVNPKLEVSPIPGASSLTTALSVCGFNVVPFAFLGFAPKKDKKDFFENAGKLNMPFVFYDSPLRVVDTLLAFSEALGGQRNIYVGRELTKIHETHYRGAVSSVIAKINDNTRGEFVVVADKV
ncbi:16S rRNA (cytidine(1402)-2'-O)-methyltransferase [Candidatus Microgenomates bacterium]|nr:MAG: 16S rRNA (cytidine(1402)-2'-O)-methyltransferase [Candidatus Microgenomates bacterium]